MVEDVLFNVGIYIAFPALLGVGVALPFWLRRRILLGNAVGSGVIAVVMVLFILERFATLVSQGPSVQDPLMPMFLLALAGWLDVFIVFVVSGFVEDRVKKRVVNPNDF